MKLLLFIIGALIAQIFIRLIMFIIAVIVASVVIRLFGCISTEDLTNVFYIGMILAIILLLSALALDEESIQILDF